MDDGQQLISGVGVSPGRVTGPVATLAPAVPEPLRERLPLADLETAAASIGESASRAERALTAAAARPGISDDARAILEATATMAADPMLTREAVRKVRSEHVPAARAVWEAANEVAEQFAAMGGYLAERVKDIHDVRDRIVADLTGAELPGLPERDAPYVLVATDLSPALTATLDASHVIAIVTVEGGPASHTAILARSRGIPAVVAAAGARQLVNGETVIVDGAAGTVTRNPGARAVRALAGKAKEPRAYVRPCQTTDGHRVPILANIGTLDDAVTAAAAGCDGVGLLRTEIAYLDRSEAPSIAEQTEFYRAVFDAFPGRKVVIRTLDAGADKPLPFVTSAPEENPALGVRGLRTVTTHPQLLEDQLAAIGAAAQLSSAMVWVMAPMVATADECADFVARCAAHGIETAGIMVEVPAAALQASHLLASAAFASIGTNDLTQYTMAADRLSAGVAHLCDPWNPSVLQLIAATCAGGERNDRPVGVCGEAAADPALAVVLVGLGVDSLSMSPRSMGDVAAVLATVSLAEARQIATTALASRDAASARAAARAALPQLVDLEL